MYVGFRIQGETFQQVIVQGICNQDVLCADLISVNFRLNTHLGKLDPWYFVQEFTTPQDRVGVPLGVPVLSCMLSEVMVHEPIKRQRTLMTIIPLDDDHLLLTVNLQERVRNL